MAVTELTLSTRRLVSASPHRVWAVFADAARWPEWSGVVAEVSAAPARWEPGERLAFRLRMGPSHVGFDVRLVDVVPAKRVAWTSVRWTVTGTRTHTFVPAQGGTEIIDDKHFAHAFWPLRWAYPRGTIKRMSAAWLADLGTRAAQV